MQVSMLKSSWYTIIVDMQIDKSAPAYATDNIDISAPIERVWDILTDINHWHEWNSDVISARMDGPLQVGTTFTWQAGPSTITSRLEHIEPPKLVVWSGKTMGITAVHAWHLTYDQGVTIVTTEETWDGLLPRLLKGYSKKTLAKAIVSALAALKAQAEK